MSGRLHADALETLAAWHPPAGQTDQTGQTAAEQERLRRRYLSHLESTPDGMWRSSFPDHLTAGTLVVSRTGDEVLLNLHRKAQRWFAFGGHAEPEDVTLAGVAAREAREESGLRDLEFAPHPLQLDIHPVAFCDPRGTVHHLDVRYGARDLGTEREQASDESLEVRWWSVNDLPEIEPSMHRLIALVREALC